MLVNNVNYISMAGSNLSCKFRLVRRARRKVVCVSCRGGARYFFVLAEKKVINGRVANRTQAFFSRFLFTIVIIDRLIKNGLIF